MFSDLICLHKKRRFESGELTPGWAGWPGGPGCPGFPGTPGSPSNPGGPGNPWRSHLNFSNRSSQTNKSKSLIYSLLIIAKTNRAVLLAALISIVGRSLVVAVFQIYPSAFEASWSRVSLRSRRTLDPKHKNRINAH